jgi:hypothetical protein
VHRTFIDTCRTIIVSDFLQFNNYTMANGWLTRYCCNRFIGMGSWDLLVLCYLGKDRTGLGMGVEFDWTVWIFLVGVGYYHLQRCVQNSSFVLPHKGWAGSQQPKDGVIARD